jgi:hypothetical protein
MVLGSNPLAFLRFLPLKRRVPEREAMVRNPPVVVSLFVMILGIAKTKTMPPVVVFAVSPPKFPRT